MNYLKCIVSAIILLLCFIGCGNDSSSSGNRSFRPSNPERITFAGVGEFGIFDPSITKDPNNGRLWMSYSALEQTIFYPDIPVYGVETRLAFSDDSGATWTDAGMVVAPFYDEVLGDLPVTPPGTAVPAGTKGTWLSEMSTLIYDPAAPVNERWKLMWHQYLLTSIASHFVDYAWISLKMAATPLDLAAAPTIKMFGGWELESAGESTASPAFSPVAGAPLIHLDTDLNQVASPGDVTELESSVFAEPGLIAANGAVYLSMMCMTFTPGIENYIILLKCVDLDNFLDSASWHYIGRLTTPDDGADIGYSHLAAPDLVEQDGTYYLITTPSDNSLYVGTWIYEFIDLDTGELVQSNGVLTPVLRIDGVPTSHNGAAGYHSDLSGVIYSEFQNTEWPEAFKIFQSNVRIP